MNAKARLPTIPTFAEVAAKKSRREPLTALDCFVYRFDQGGEKSLELAVALQGLLVEAKDAEIIEQNRAQRQAVSEDFDTWSKNPYTLVLQKSLAEDYVPKHGQQRQAVQDAEIAALREAGKKALSALDTHAEQYPHMTKGYCVDAARALRVALKQP